MFDVIMLSVALAMDAFAIALSLGMSGLVTKLNQKIQIGFTFGGFQASLFILGYFTISSLGDMFISTNSYFAALLLLILGIKMIKDALDTGGNICEHEHCFDCKKIRCIKTGEYRKLSLKILLIYGLATSIDSLIAGVSFYGKLDNTLFATLSVGIITFIFSFFGSAFGMKLKMFVGNKANLIGGSILIILAIKSIL